MKGFALSHYSFVPKSMPPAGLHGFSHFHAWNAFSLSVPRNVLPEASELCATSRALVQNDSWSTCVLRVVTRSQEPHMSMYTCFSNVIYEVHLKYFRQLREILRSSYVLCASRQGNMISRHIGHLHIYRYQTRASDESAAAVIEVCEWRTRCFHTMP